MIKKFKEVEISVEDLLLDPNNPRFSKNVVDITDEEHLEDEDNQKKAFDNMIAGNFEIKELADSIKEKGFLSVDKIFIRKINKKYLVIEGNRRITALKFLLEKHKSGMKNYQLSENVIASFKKINCVDLTGEDENMINLILGLRHHGSIKEWGLLPSSFHLFQRYMIELVRRDGGNEKDHNQFIYDSKINNIVADLFSIKESVVRNKIKSYRLLLQLQDNGYNVGDRKFSMIDETIKKSKIREFFGYNEESSIFTEEGCELFAKLCIGVDGNPPIITAPASGSSSLRDFGYVLENGNDYHINSIIEEGKESSLIFSEIKDHENKRGVLKTFEKIYDELGKIDFKSVEIDGYSEEAIEHFKMIDKIFETVRRAIFK